MVRGGGGAVDTRSRAEAINIVDVAKDERVVIALLRHGVVAT